MKSVLVGALALGAGILIGTVLPPWGGGGMHTASKEDGAATPEAHTHAMIEVDRTLPLPAVAIELVPDSMSGYNLRMMTENFTFTPEGEGDAPKPNEGHAHVYINDVKVGRAYGEWYHLPGSLFTPGKNTVMVTLNANEHSDWAYEGGHIGAALTFSF
jgi:hypothetical protein